MRHLLLVVLAAVPACDAYDHDLGTIPYLCGDTAPRCPADYSCVEDTTTGDEICVADGTTPTAFDCANDSAIEPNDTLSKATATSAGSYQLAEAAICPATDRDNFALPVTTATAIDLEVVFPKGATLRAAILNEGGVPIATAKLDAENRTLRASATGLVAGMYYAQVAGADGHQNNYSITLRTR